MTKGKKHTPEQIIGTLREADVEFNGRATTGSQTLATTEDDSGSYASLHLAETTVSSSDITQSGNDFSGNYTAMDHPTNTSTLTENGYNGEGTFTLSETTADSPTVRTTGNFVSNASTITTTGSQGYGVHQYNASGGDHYTMDETGAKSHSCAATAASGPT